MKKRLIITESQMISLIEQYSNAEILFTPKDKLAKFFNDRMGFSLYKDVFKISYDSFFAETVDGAPIFLNSKGFPYFDLSKIDLLRNSQLLAGYINAMRYKKGTIKTYRPRIKDVIYVDNNNCMFKVIDIDNNVLLVDMGTNLSVYNLTSNREIIDNVTGDSRKLSGKNCINFPNFKPDKNLIDKSLELQNQGSEISGKSNDEKIARRKENEKMEEIRDAYQIILNNIYKGIPISRTLQDNNIRFSDLKKYLPVNKFENLFDKEEMFRNMNYINEIVDVSKKIDRKTVVDLIFDAGFLFSFGFSKISSYAINDNAKDEIKKMMGIINRQPLLNGMTYFDVIDNISKVVDKVPLTIAILRQLEKLIDYARPRIKLYIVDNDDLNRKENWLKRLDILKERCVDILSVYND